MAQILLAEDEADLNALIARELRQEGHEVLQVYDGLDALQACERESPDIIILDWMLPGLDGIAVCRKLRERHVVPVLMLTARGEEADIVLGLEVGADDYVTKPFRMRELLARVRAILRRSELAAGASPVTGGEATITAGPITVNQDERTAAINGHLLDLTRREFELLDLFVHNPGRVFSREYILDRVWSSDYEVTDRTVDTHVQRLRRKLGDGADLIRTVWGLGYKLQLDR
jgi:DNA-binding response OmpR family regulator